jgi:hypothetical protein
VTTAVVRDVVDVLLTHHALIEEQFRAVATATRKPQRKAAFVELARLLTVHETIEQALVHPRAAGDTEAEVVAERVEEERRADEVLAELFEIEVNDPDFPVLLQGLKESVLAHATREERYEFPRLRHAEPPERLRELAEAVTAAFEAAPAKLPSSRNGPVAALTAVRERVLEAVRAAGTGSS